MEIMRGKTTSWMDAPTLGRKVQGCARVHIDLGTGDGRYVQHLALRQPQTLVIGVDACRENLRDASRRAPENALFVIANAQELPPLLHGCADQLSVHFPWGSLLQGLLAEEDTLRQQMSALLRPQAALDLIVNGGALAEQGWALEDGAAAIRQRLMRQGWRVEQPQMLTGAALRAYPTSWARRLAFGRDPRALHLRAQWAAQQMRSA